MQTSCSSVLVVVILSLTIHGGTADLRQYMKNIFFADEDALINHVAIHNGNVYVAARNRLYQLDKSLKVIHSVVTGPVQDDVNCFIQERDSKCKNIKLTNNTNKLLLVDVQNKRLVVCGSVYQGTCKTRNLENITEVYYEIPPNGNITVVTDEFIACNEEHCSTVGVITQGPTVNSNVLYVAATQNGYLLRPDYSISTHSLAHDPQYENKLFRLTIKGTTHESVFKKPIKNVVRDYKHTFATGNEDGFVYYVFSSSSQNDPVSKAVVARICKSDPVYDSYIELPIVCSQATANHLVAANYIPDSSSVDSDGTLYLLFSTNNRASSALCSIRKSRLDYLFYNTMELCYKTQGLDGSTPVAKLINTNAPKQCNTKTWLKAGANLTNNVIYVQTITLPYYAGYTIPKKQILCGAYYLPSQIERLVDTPAMLLFEKQGVTFTAITTSQTGTSNRTTIAFLGTMEGSLVQVNLNTRLQYATIDVGDQILPNFVWDSDPGLAVPHLFVTTQHKVLRIQVAACEKFLTCNECVMSKDPYCGWCILESRCSTKEQCTTADFDKTRWIGPDAQKCITATPPQPRERALNGQISTNVYLLPVLEANDRYECLFDGEFPSPASLQKSGSNTDVTCQAPTQEQLPPSAPGQDYVNVSLSLRYNGGVVIVSTTAIFFDCHAHGKDLQMNTPCSGCLSSQWGCKWCIDLHMCKAKEETEDGCITNQNICPTFTAVRPEDQLISVGQPRSITLVGKNLPNLDTTYWCSVTIGHDDPISVEATKTGNNVTCKATNYNYSENLTEAPGNIMVTHRLTFNVDFAENDPLTFYKCSVGRSDCSLCVTADSRYSCGWCESKQQCTIQTSCPTRWITNALLCPEHEIKSFYPTSGPRLGGTRLTINGVNMGAKPGDIQKVIVALQTCNILDQFYETSNRVVCETSAAPFTHGKVSVTIRNITKHSEQDFYYRDPVPKQLLTDLGPQAGGTLINVTGEYLDTGSNISVTIGSFDPLPCDVRQATESYLTCVTRPAPRPIEGMSVTLRYDKLSIKLPQTFRYTPDPQVNKAFSMSEGPALASFLGGGRNITFVGTNLNSVKTPVLIAETGYHTISDPQRRRRRRRSSPDSRFTKRHFLRSIVRRRQIRSADIDAALSAFTTKLYSSLCTVVNSTHMFCPTPEVSTTLVINVSSNISQYVQLPAQLHINMDNHRVNLSNKLTYFPNPRVEQLSENKKYKENDFLVLSIYNLNKDAITKDEIVVLIGSSRCYVKAFVTDEPLCKVPKKEGDDVIYPVHLTIGNLRQNIGTMEYEIDQQGIPTAVIAGIVAASVAVIVVIIIIIIYCNRKTYKSNKNDFQKAIENLEMSVRADFRKAFAELSIDMTDLAGDIVDYGIPCLDYRTYITNLFFPMYRYHPCMNEPKRDPAMSSDLEHGLNQFLLLLSHQNFLTLFVRTLEEQKNFATRDKGNVASLLSVVLHEKLDYFTQIMKSLVSDLIRANVKKNNPKLIMRRSDSVAERMLSNWMYICLYPYLRDSAGSPLFLLLKAIKQQVSKGPLDAITGKARYTLSDDRLLKDDIEFETLTFFVQSSSEDEPVIVKVLSCDSVAQVKEKVMDAVYKRVPFSQRPRPEQLDLEWRQGRNGHLVLPTQDYSMEPGSRWRRLMSINDYKLKSSSTLALIRRQQEIEGSQDTSSAMSNHSVDISPLSPMLPEDGSNKTYHLVKYTDDNEAKRESTIPRDKHKHIPELYLLRLINMKGILQNYVDGVMQAILDKNRIPCPVRHFFHFLDEIAAQYDNVDKETLYIWKTNSFHLRFWVTILKNPEAVFDVEKPDTIASTMAVISQTFIDACSMNEHLPTKDSPINKQIYAKEIPNYKKMVQEYYQVIKEQHPVSEQEVNTYIADISRSYACKFDKNRALRELWSFVSKYYEEINEALENDPNVPSSIIQKLEQAYTLIESNTANST